MTTTTKANTGSSFSFRPARRLRKDPKRTASRLISCAILILLGFVLVGLYLLASSLLQQQQPRSTSSSSTPLVLLNIPESCTITTDVRGNLGPAEVMLNNGTDWLKDRWQAASDMGGTAIRGSHWVQLEFLNKAQQPSFQIHSVVLDWETAYSDHYQLQIRHKKEKEDADEDWTTIFTAPDPSIRVTRYGQSPGVKEPMPLHVIHNVTLPNPVEVSSSSSSAPLFLFRILILKSITGWGVSLWRVQLFGTRGSSRSTSAS